MSREGTADTRLADVVADVQIPLDNLAYTIQAYLLANGARLDTDTRLLLAGIRDCADQVAGSVRRISRQTAPEPRCARMAPDDARQAIPRPRARV